MSAYVEALKKEFGEHFSDRKLERIAYSYDLAEFTPDLKMMMGIHEPVGVVRILSEDDAVKLIKMAREHGFAVIPRAKGSSGYGGVLSLQKNCIVADVNYLNRVKKIDKENLTVTVEPGIVWKELDEALKEQGLTLRLYPSSYPSSTVGGWLAQGGTGIGGFEYGWFKENVVSARVVLPDGTVKEFTGDELRTYIADTEGILGIITEVTLKVRPLEKDVVKVIAFDNEDQLSGAANYMFDNNVPLWSMTFINPESCKVKNIFPGNPYAHGVAHKHKGPKLPEKYLLIIVYPESRESEVKPHIDEVVKRFSGEVLSDEIAQHEWEERFAPMKVKRLSPTLIPAEVVLPVKNVGEFLKRIKKEIKRPIVFEGFFVKGGDAILLGLIPSDIRSFSFKFESIFGILFSKLGEKLGGRPITSGIYFTSEVEKIFGKDRIQRVRELKKKLDPDGIMNPKKFLENKRIESIMKMSSLNAPFMKILANSLPAVPLKERFDKNKKIKDIPEEFLWYAYSCTRCGFCVNSCTQYGGFKWESTSPRAKWYFLREMAEGRLEPDQLLVDIFLGCTLCNFCDVECQIELPILHVWDKMREILVYDQNFSAFPALEVMAAAAKKEGNIWAGPAKDRDAFMPEDLRKYTEENKGKTDTAFFFGCTAAYVEPEVAIGAMRMLKDAGVKYTTLGKEEYCCGIPMVVSGRKDVFEHLFDHNVRKMKELGIKTIITACPSCHKTWKLYYEELAKEKGVDFPFEIKHYTEVLAEKLDEGKFKFKQKPKYKDDTGEEKDIDVITLHDTCKLGRTIPIHEPPRKLLKAIPGLKFVEMKHNRDKVLCCGGAGTLVKNPKVAHDIGLRKLKEAEEAGADAVAMACPCCQFKLKVDRDYWVEKGKLKDLKVVDLAAIYAKAMGYDLKESDPYVRELWGTFEAMVELMDPPQMAKFMAEYLPQMIEAMPEPYRGMMKMMKSSPTPVKKAMLAMMKPMMPKLFPKMLPEMMPKLMPIFMEGMSKRIPMPEFLQKQMPELMPIVMENYMKGHLPLIINYFMPLMERWVLEGRV